MPAAFQPGDVVVWWKGAGGDFVAPVRATVVRVTAKRVTIVVEDPDEKGAGVVTRHVSAASLQLQGPRRASRPVPLRGAVRRARRRQA
jgi:hypothetical protein